jgi:hypothetical protein
MEWEWKGRSTFFDGFCFLCFALGLRRVYGLFFRHGAELQSVAELEGFQILSLDK